ncbi:hypothetical protein [Streptomyces sp. NPDC056192]|uniref:hypothetical protein n=1 Tax=Streptomyces sp. NPDC056192 TaxID=3345743 RepID=UPI0035E063F3
MTISVRRKIPRLICASCLTTGLLLSAGATTAVAASQSPTEVSAMGSESNPWDGGRDGGGGGGRDGGRDGGDWGGGRDGGRDGGDWGGGRDGWPKKGHGDDGWPKKGHGSHTIDHPIDKTVDHPIDKTVDHPIDKTVDHPIDKTVDHPIDQTVDHPIDQTVDQTVDQTGETEEDCAKKKGIWADGYCGEWNVIQGPQTGPSAQEEEDVKTATAIVECTKFVVGSVFNLGTTTWKVIEGVTTGAAVIQDVNTGHQVDAVAKVIPGVTCLMAITAFVPVDQVE